MTDPGSWVEEMFTVQRVHEETVEGRRRCDIRMLYGRLPYQCLEHISNAWRPILTGGQWGGGAECEVLLGDRRWPGVG